MASKLKCLVVDEAFVPENAYSVSQIGLFNRCRKAWKYSYKDNLMKRQEKLYFTKGKLVHIGMQSAWLYKWLGENQENPLFIPGLDSMLEIGISAMIRWYTGFFEENYKDMNLEEIEELEAVFQAAQVIFIRSLTMFKPDEWEVVEIQGRPAVETHYLIKMNRYYSMHGFIDLIARHIESDQIWQIDWKIMSSLSPEEDELYNMQNTVYNIAAQSAGIPVAGSMTYQILGVESTIPKVNKNGSISRALIRCTWDEYSKFCVDNGQNPDEYEEEMVPKLGQIEWVRTNKEYMNYSVSLNIWKQVIMGTVREIRRVKTHLPSISAFNCKNCQFGALCLAEIRGYDVDFILEDQYKVREGKNG